MDTIGYYIRYNGQAVGPVSKYELKNYGLRPESMVWRQGMPSWMPAYALPDLKDVVAETSATPPPFDTPPRDFNSPLSGLEYTGASGKSRLVFGLFAIFLGWIGLQYFYVNKTGAGIICILLTLFSCSLWQLISIVQGILVLAMDQDTFEEKYVYTSSAFPLF